jgi:hypothetical protein
VRIEESMSSRCQRDGCGQDRLHAALPGRSGGWHHAVQRTFNLACHKVAPADRGRNSIVLKAPPQSPGVVHEIAKMFVDAGAPPAP